MRRSQQLPVGRRFAQHKRGRRQTAAHITFPARESVGKDLLLDARAADGWRSDEPFALRFRASPRPLGRTSAVRAVS
jgi:hypothetical protein